MPDALAARHQHERHLALRASSQIGYAKALGRLHPDRTAAWAAPIAAAEAAAARLAGEPAKLVAEVEAALAPLAAAAKTITIHCVGHAHIDMNWQWSWQETVATTDDTFLSMLRLMDEFPTFTFTQDQAAVYELMRRHHPETFDRIRARVAEGRWEVTASHWVEGDRNLAGGEALIRQLAEARAFCRDHLGLKPEDITVDWPCDCFGHAATLPLIDAGAGVKYCYLMRSGGLDRPELFRWRHPAGGAITVYRDPRNYNGAPRAWLAEKAVDFALATGRRDHLLSYGVGDHGGGPTRRDLRCVLDMDAWPVFPRWRFSTANAFFTAVAAGEMSVREGELNYEYSGCYSAQSPIKRANRANENACAAADQAAALGAALAQAAVPQERLREAWRDTVFGHFHDILPGSGVPATRHYHLGQAQGIAATAGAVAVDRLRAVAARIDTSFAAPAAAAEPISTRDTTSGEAGAGRMSAHLPQTGVAVGHPGVAVVMNPCAWERREVVRLAVWENEAAEPGERWQPNLVVRQADGAAVPAQTLRRGRYWGHNFVEIAFPVAVGPLGWTAYAVEEGRAEPPAAVSRLEQELEGNRSHPPPVQVPSGMLALDNGLLRLEFDKASGGLRRLTDLASGRDFAPAVARAWLHAAVERPYPMSAWIINDDADRGPWRCDAVEPVLPEPLPGHGNQASPSHVAAVRLRYRWRESRFSVTVSLPAGCPWFEVEVEGRWFERGGPEAGTPRLELLLPFGGEAPVLACEIPCGSIERREALGREVPAARWVDLRTEDGSGLLVANDGAQAWWRAPGGGVGATLLRASYDPDPMPEIGDHRWRFLVRPHSAALGDAVCVQAGAGFNAPLTPVGTPRHAGRLPARLAVGLSCEGALITQVKPAEDGQGLIVRLQECAGKAGDAVLRVAGELGRIVGAEACDLLERPLPGTAVRVDGQDLRLTVAACGLATVRVHLGGRPSSGG